MTPTLGKVNGNGTRGHTRPVGRKVEDGPGRFESIRIVKGETDAAVAAIIPAPPGA